MRRVLKIFGYSFVLLLLFLAGTIAYIHWGLAPEIPQPENSSYLELQREKAGENFYRIGNNWLQKNKNGIWEEYVEGEPFERGVILGKLNKEMLYTQEEAFLEQIHQLVPNDNYLKFLHLVSRVFNRDIDEYIPPENRLEIYGESFSAPHDFDFISPAYDRMLNYHTAHDLGHAFQSLALVGCTSFSAWGARSEDSSLIIGRNLDFSLGDRFAQDKIVYFCKPSTGYKFAMVTWAGFMGCVSGMNEKGLTVTINAAKSDVPSKATTPISILAREILQYAGNIEEAYVIAKKKKTFVCETLMIGSAADHKTALIEKSIAKTSLFQSDTNYILCTNHYQSMTFENDKSNLENMATSASMYRYKRLEEILGRQSSVNYLNMASILRNQRGLNDAQIGMGNEKAINQLLSHHAVIFQPEKLRMWVSANPYQLGEFVCYDLSKVFQMAPLMKIGEEITESHLTIPPDSFLYSKQWKDFLLFKKLKQEITRSIQKKSVLKNEKSTLDQFQNSNPEFWETYSLIARYYSMLGNKTAALTHYEMALTKEINDTHEADKIKEQISKIKR